MCGIFGSFEFKNYKKLYNENKKRGTFSLGWLYTNRDGSIFIGKREGTTNLTSHHSYKSKYHLFTGHTQAPTSCIREATSKSMHPFEYGNWIVAHNGVLENYKELIGLHFPDHDNDVDSSVIPRLLDYMHGGDEVYTISESLGSLKGTYGCFIYNKVTRNMYIVRSGSTLYGNIKKGAFSSIKVPGICTKELEEGVIYHVSMDGLTAVGGFANHSPFFLL